MDRPARHALEELTSELTRIIGVLNARLGNLEEWAAKRGYQPPDT